MEDQEQLMYIMKKEHMKDIITHLDQVQDIYNQD